MFFLVIPNSLVQKTGLKRVTRINIFEFCMHRVFNRKAENIGWAIVKLKRLLLEKEVFLVPAIDDPQSITIIKIKFAHLNFRLSDSFCDGPVHAEEVDDAHERLEDRSRHPVQAHHRHQSAQQKHPNHYRHKVN